MKIRFFKTLIVYVLPIILLGYLFSQIGVERVISSFKKLDISWYLLAFLIFVLTQLFNSQRIKISASSFKITLFKLFKITNLYTFYNSVLPSRTGELSLVFLLKKYSGTHPSRGFMTLATIRFLDYFLNFSIYLVLLLIYWRVMPQILQTFMIIFVPVVMLALSLGICILVFKKRFIRLLLTLLSETKIARVSFCNKLVSFLKTVLKDFQEIRSGNLYILLFIWTAIIVFLRWIIAYFVVRSTGFNLTIANLLFLSIAQLLSRAIQSVGNFGTQEAGYTAAFMSFGVPKEEAITLSISVHLLELTLVLALAGLSALTLKANKTEDSGESYRGASKTNEL